MIGLRTARVLATGLMLAIGLAACAPLAPEPVPAPDLPAMRWDHRPEAAEWTATTIETLSTRGTTLLSTVPSDIAQWCPAYPEADADRRAAFWSGLFSAIARYESTWNPRAIGGGGLYHGLLQILPATARGVGCEPGQLLDGATNLNCAVRIADRRVAVSDGSVAGITADWGPMHWADKRAEMAGWIRAQSYCQPAPEPAPLLALFGPNTRAQ